MKKLCITIVALALCGGAAFSQSNLDAYRFSTSDLNGTARYLGMGGAFGALGGDISAMKSNPAGLAVYRSSEIVTTLSVNTISAETNWLGTQRDRERSNVSFDNIAYVGYFPTGNYEGVVSWNVGFSYNRLKNFRRNYDMSSGDRLRNSVSDYIAERAYGYTSGQLGGDNSYSSNLDWLSVLGYNANFINPHQDDKGNTYYNSVYGDFEGSSVGIHDAILKVRERGAIDQYNIAFGINISDMVLLGAGMAFTDIDYHYESSYDELFEYEEDELYLDNGLSVDGTGYSFNLGVILRPTDNLRFGIAYNSPVWYDMSDYYYGQAGSSIQHIVNEEWVLDESTASTPEGAVTDYKLRAPDKWLFSAAAVIGQSALLSVDYELVNYKNMHLDHDNGASNREANATIKNDFKVGGTLRVGGEFKATPQFSVRAGGSWSFSPLKNPVKNGETEIYTVGTIPNYTLDKGTDNYTVGLGYRFTPNFYTDIACVFSNHKEDVYAFSPVVDGIKISETPQPASMKTKTTRVALTLGYKF